ncbi:hypothetical protein Esi_0166_0037 [Ectocarpus siliculosus]|uniref:Uncharacterized protein n=1 Tax=Ectocarpus siliculosus TaxID=2880 RepID=D7FMB5_ECTSI|nr:hypothetical protein Esi_0166_0037 [Ectocarpus siliculosus]|eukprot:CBJ29933.1 hypothetical protein Esi_0166_0037 [Ectocarpus siliculosus]
MYLSTRDRVKPCRVIALTRRPIPRPASPPGISISMQRRLGLSPRTTPDPHAANRTARVGEDKIKHRSVGMTCDRKHERQTGAGNHNTAAAIKDIAEGVTRP